MRYAPPGRLVSVGRHRLHTRCEGDGRPTVVFDAALGGSSISWSLVQPAVARVTRACTYDRAGFGWSDPGPLPRTAARIVDELHELLARSDVPPPYVLVGHSFGGLVTRLFAARHPAEIGALVFIEPAHPEEWLHPTEEQRLLIDRGTRLCSHGAVAARIGLARAVEALVGLGAFGPARALVKMVSRGGLRRQDEGILAPVWRLPAEARQPLRQMWTRPGFFEALGSQIASVCESAAEVDREARGGYGDLPVVTITAEGAGERRLQADAALARLSTRGRQVLAPNSGHWIPLDAPQVVIDAIVDVVNDVRGSRNRAG